MAPPTLMVTARMGHAHGHDQESHDITVELAPEARSVTRARQRALEAAAAWDIPASVKDRLALVVTELASNAVTHARSTFRVHLQRRDSTIRGEVVDADPEPPIQVNPAPRATAGRGLMIVRHLTDRAGVDDTLSGKSVWFEIDVPA